MKRFSSAALSTLGAFLVAASALNPAPARAQQLDFSLWFNERDSYSEIFRAWAPEVEKRTQGRVTFKPHYSGSLVSATETFNAIRKLVIPSGVVNASFASGAVRPLAYVEPAFWLPDDVQTASSVLEKLRPKLEEVFRAQGTELIMSVASPGFLVACASKHIKDVNDWKGLKVRAAGRWQGIQVRAVGSSPVAIDPGEQYLALQNKTVDCALSLATLTHSLRLYEVAPYITYYRQAVNTNFYVVNADVWKKISPADQAAIKAVSAQIEKTSTATLLKYQDEAIEAIIKAKGHVHRPSPAELAATKKAMGVVWSEVEKFAGAGGVPIAAELKPYW